MFISGSPPFHMDPRASKTPVCAGGFHGQYHSFGSGHCHVSAVVIFIMVIMALMDMAMLVIVVVIIVVIIVVIEVVLVMFGFWNTVVVVILS